MAAAAENLLFLCIVDKATAEPPWPRERARPMSWQDRITIDPKVLVGKPVIKGTRISVEFLTELLANGWTHEQILKNYPHLTEEDIQAALHYATEAVKQEHVYPLPV